MATRLRGGGGSGGGDGSARGAPGAGADGPSAEADRKASAALRAASPALATSPKGSIWSEHPRPRGWTAARESLSNVPWAKMLPQFGLAKLVRDYSDRKSVGDKLSGDISAGLVVAIMLIPQALAYASLAGMPLASGYHTAILVCFLYPFFGLSPYQAVGPAAVMSLLSEAGVSGVMEAEGSEGLERFVELSAKLAFLIGVIQVGMGLFRVGFVANFLSHPVLAAFTSASAIIIGSGQLNKALGYSIPKVEQVWETWYWVARNLPKTNWPSILLFLADFAMLRLLAKGKAALGKTKTVKSRPWLAFLLKMAPAGLVMIVSNILLVWGAGLKSHGVKIVGSVPAGMPPLQASHVLNERFSSDASALLPSAILTALVAFMESVSVARAMAAKYGGDTVNPDQELWGLGAANAFAALFGGFTTAGGFSRSGVNADAGAKTPLAGILTAAILSLVASFGTHLFYFLPDVALAALVMDAAAKLFDVSIVRQLWAVDKFSCSVWAITVIATLADGVETGLMVGAGISLLRVIQEAAMPHTAVLGRMPDGRTFRNVARFPDTAIPVPDVAILRIDGPLFFANCSRLSDQILSLAYPRGGAAAARPSPGAAARSDAPGAGTADAASSVAADAAALTPSSTSVVAAPPFSISPSLVSPGPRVVLLDLSGVTSIDFTATHFVLEELPLLLRKSQPAWWAATGGSAAAMPRPPRVLICGAHGPVRDRLRDAERFEEDEHDRNALAAARAKDSLARRWCPGSSAASGPRAAHTGPSAAAPPAEHEVEGDGDVELAPLRGLPSSLASRPVDAVLAQPSAAVQLLRHLDVAHAVDAITALLAATPDRSADCLDAAPALPRPAVVPDPAVSSLCKAEELESGKEADTSASPDGV